MIDSQVVTQGRAKMLPTIEDLGAELEAQGLVRYIEKHGRYIQTDDNCLNIASQLADRFGFKPPKSYREFYDLLMDYRSDAVWGTSNAKPVESPACLVVYHTNHREKETDDVHVAFELNGREYNYGVTVDHDFSIDRRIPIPIKTN